MINPVINKIIAPTPGSASANPAKSSAEGASAEKFGAVLAKQIGEKPSADSKRTSHSSAQKSSQTGNPTTDERNLPDQGTISATITSDPLAGFLKGNLTIKADRPTDIQADQTTQPADAQIPPFALPVNPELKLTVLPATDPVTGKSARQAAEPLGATREKMTGVMPAAIEQSPIATKTLTLTDKETFKLADPATSLPAANAQAMAQSASSAITPTPMAPTNQTTIAAPLGSPAWPAEFTQKINWVSTQQNQVAELHLNPPDLGPMSVTITINDNQATALFSSPHSAVREAIENAMPKLRESLADNGIMLGNATVNDQAPRDSGASGFTNQRTPSPQTHTTTETAINPVPVAQVSRHNGLVDTFA
ncbi:MAG: flagellar hook-length control protein FliK [Gallionella sp.]|nr:flagellar hook-length control protein FliK [Gallionella sp.]